MDETETSADTELKAERLTRISYGSTDTKINKSYSRIVKRIAIILPVIALILLITVLNWNAFKDDTISPLQEEAKAVAQQTIGKNELLNPRFDSMDSKGQPYSITANRALQEENDEDLLTLENPSGIMMLNNGGEVTLGSLDGTYRQAVGRLFLQDNVIMTHREKDATRGYQMTTEELHIDTKAGTARTNVRVNAQGPAGTLEANGMNASSNDEALIFTGPAKLVLILEGDLNLGEFAP